MHANKAKPQYSIFYSRANKAKPPQLGLALLPSTSVHESLGDMFIPYNLYFIHNSKFFLL